MTRINVVPVATLHTKQLHGEYVELPRVFVTVRNRVLGGRGVTDGEIPATYRLGPGHVLFFANKLGYLAQRYDQICDELRARGFNLNPRLLHLEFVSIPPSFWGQYDPTPDAIKINQARIDEALASMQQRGIA